MEIRPLQPEDAEVAARLHYQGQQHTFLGQMGVPFLTALYRELAASPWGFGLVAVAGGEVVGVVTATRSTPNLFRDLLLRRGWRLLGPTLGALLRRPAFVRHALETLTYPWKVGHVERGEFEFLFIGVRRDWRGKGVGGRLMDELIAECRRRGGRTLSTLVEDSNAISVQMHLDRGFRARKQIVLYGRPMGFYTLDLQEPAGEGARP